MPGIDNFTPIALSTSVNNIISPPTFVRNKIFTRKFNHLAKIIQTDLIIGGKKLAPFVKRGMPGKVLDKTGQKTQFIEPPHIRVKKFFEPSEVKLIRGEGQPIHTTGQSVSAGEKYIAQEQKLMKDEIVRREEWLCVQALLGGFTYTDAVEGVELVVDFLMPSANKPTLTGTSLWSDAAAKPGSNLLSWKTLISKATGKAPTVGIATRAVYEAMLNNAQVKELLNFRRAEMGAIDTTKYADEYGVTYLGNIHGVDLFEYNEEYTDAAGNTQSMIPTDKFLLVAPAADFRFHYAITDDLKAGMVSMDYFSKMWEVEDPSGMWLLTESNPLPTPHQPQAVVAAKVL